MTNLDSQKFDCQLVDNFYVLLSLINFHKTLAGGGTQRVRLCQQREKIDWQEAQKTDCPSTSNHGQVTQ